MVDDVHELTCYHEAGHAVMAALVGASIEQITLETECEDGARSYGQVTLRWQTRSTSPRREAERKVAVALAGPVAEMIYTGEPVHPLLVAEWKQDWQTAWSEAQGLLPDPKSCMQFIEKSISEIYRHFRNDDVWQAIAALADELNAHETLDRETIHDILATWIPS